MTEFDDRYSTHYHTKYLNATIVLRELVSKLLFSSLGAAIFGIKSDRFYYYKKVVVRKRPEFCE